MASMLWIPSFVLLVMEMVAGTVANGFIVLINCINWIRSKKLSPTDLILTCLGLARLMWQATVMMHVTMLFFFLHIYILKHIRVMLAIMWFFTTHVNLWFAACLGVWYLMKIATFSHPIFLQVKLRFSGLVPWLLLSSVVFSTLVTIITFTGLNISLNVSEFYRLLLNNSCDSETEMPRSSDYLPNVIIATNVLPSVIFLSSMILLIISLWKHIRHLGHNGIGVRDLNTNVHLSAIKVLASFAILYLSSFVAVILQSILPWSSNDRSWTSLFFYNVSAMYPSVHAVILILINPKLKQAWVRMIHILKCSLRETPS